MDRFAIAIPPAECWELLANSTLGRLALSIQALPIIIPVRYVVDDASVAIDIDRISMPDAAVRNSVVALAVDDISEPAEEGWLVQVQGIAHLATPAGGPGNVYSDGVVRLVPGNVTGLRFPTAPFLSGP